jgi:hypothetical protein
MKRAPLLLLTLLALTAPLARAQAPADQDAVDRLVVLAFDADDADSPYRLGLATGLQRVLNVIDGVYVPPVGDTLLVARRAEAQGTPPPLPKPSALARLSVGSSASAATVRRVSSSST